MVFFSVEDDVDDDAFLKHPPIGNSNYNPKANISSSIENNLDDVENRTQSLLQVKREIEERTAQSSQRSLSLLRHSEEVGNATAEELLRQREQLERTEKRLDEINTTLRFSQRHIQGIKSVFGSLKNYLSGKNSEPISSGPSNLSSNSKSTILEESLPSPSANSDHPGLRIRGLDNAEASMSIDRQKPVDAQQVIDKNLDEMMGSIVRLKGLAHGLGDEIESQNDLVENILSKSERSDITIQRQTKDIKRLLK
uniref:t-SNARE coiled-coil homology domain-containing protein n=1 Tax=Clastoptera arizonana TaxID=38151 RepID=A0A1B6DEK8_9HEMI